MPWYSCENKASLKINVQVTDWLLIIFDRQSNLKSKRDKIYNPSAWGFVVKMRDLKIIIMKALLWANNWTGKSRDKLAVWASSQERIQNARGLHSLHCPLITSVPSGHTHVKLPAVLTQNMDSSAQGCRPSKKASLHSFTSVKDQHVSYHRSYLLVTSYRHIVCHYYWSQVCSNTQMIPQCCCTAARKVWHHIHSHLMG